MGNRQSMRLGEINKSASSMVKIPSWLIIVSKHEICCCVAAAISQIFHYYHSNYYSVELEPRCGGDTTIILEEKTRADTARSAGGIGDRPC